MTAEISFSITAELWKRTHTLSDAFTVCKKLGRRYLWVDRLCIIQDDDTEEKAKQLAQMASVYYWATYSIVASGGDTSSGLSGVTRPRQVNQQKFKVANLFEFVEEIPDPFHFHSTWTNRGWTYQEGWHLEPCYISRNWESLGPWRIHQGTICRGADQYEGVYM